MGGSHLAIHAAIERDNRAQFTTYKVLNGIWTAVSNTFSASVA